ncbi:MAG: hypothetical protein Tsb002_13050 [Wenzhouxiangellaceae bacterium]
MNRWLYKLGGGVLGSAEAIRQTLNAIDWRQQVILVVSAPAGVTDWLEQAGSNPVQRQALLARVYARFHSISDELLPRAQAHEFQLSLRQWLEEEAADANQDDLLARGELWNSRLIAACLRQRGQPAAAVDARCFIRTQGDGAEVRQLQRWLPEPPQVAVITGFIARDDAGNTRTLGRDGSDYSAALIAEAWSADRLILFTDTRGIRSADPRQLGGAGKRIAVIGQREARDLLRFGGGVLHPRTLKPLQRAAITAWIAHPADPGCGTEIRPGSFWPSGGIGLFTDHSGLAPRLLIPLPGKTATEHGLRACRPYWPEIQSYGHGLELPVTTPHWLNQQLQAMHRRIYEQPAEVGVVLIGPGRVGTALIKQLSDNDLQLRLQQQLALPLRLILNSRGCCHAEQPQPAQHAAQLLPWLQQQEQALIIVDTTASPEVAALHESWLDAGHGVVTANKHALSASAGLAQRLLAHQHYAAGATVGAGLPMIQQLRQRLHQGQPPEWFSGVLSGSVNFILDQLHHGLDYHDTLQQARHLGLVEPDPDEDLGGWDSARKLLILARSLGGNQDFDEIELRPAVSDPDGRQLQAEITAARSQGQVLRYIADCEHGRLRLGLRRLNPDHPLAVKGVNNALISQPLDSDQDSLLVGPGAGPEVTAANLLDDLTRLALLLRANRRRRAA